MDMEPCIDAISVIKWQMYMYMFDGLNNIVHLYPFRHKIGKENR